VRSLPDAIAKVLARHSGFRVNGKVEDKLPATNGNGLANGNGMSNGHTVPVHADAAKPEEIPANQLTLPTSMPAEQPVMASASNTSLFDICPECGTGSFAYEEGCKKCYSCGYSEC
jgi:ribonucleoside-diphosphate reductase alpha chain